MIGKLTGTLDSYGEDFIIVDVGGVGYVVHCSARTLQALPAPGDPVVLAIETHGREDQIRLFGAIEERRAPQPVADAISALVNLGYGQPQAAAAIAAAAQSAGEATDAASLIRLGLRELSR